MIKAGAMYSVTQQDQLRTDTAATHRFMQGEEGEEANCSSKLFAIFIFPNLNMLPFDLHAVLFSVESSSVVRRVPWVRLLSRGKIYVVPYFYP